VLDCKAATFYKQFIRFSSNKIFIYITIFCLLNIITFFISCWYASCQHCFSQAHSSLVHRKK